MSSQPDKRPSILFASRPIAPPWDEGGKNMICEIAKRLDTYSSILLTYRDQQNFLPGNSVRLERIYSRMKTQKGFVPLVSLSQKIRCAKALIFSKAAIYHFFFTPNMVTALVMRALKKFKKGIFVQTVPTTVPDWKGIGRFVSGDVVVLQSDYSLELLRKETNNLNLVRIYPGVDVEKFKPGLCADGARLRWGVLPDDTAVFYGGNYYLEGWETLRDAILSVCKTERRIKFILACRLVFAEDLVKKMRIQAAVEREGFKDRVVFLDTVDNITELIALSDISIFPPTKMWGKSEIPMILLEALTMGKPIVITDIPPLNEIMKDDVGQLVPPGDSRALAEAIVGLARDLDLRREKGARARKMALAEFNIETTVKKYRELYDKLLSRGQQR